MKKVSFRLPDDELKYIDKVAEKSGKTRSECIRQLLLSTKEKEVLESKEHYQLNKELIYEINKIGNNINQIVKDYNSHIYTDYEKKKLFALMQKLISFFS